MRLLLGVGLAGAAIAVAVVVLQRADESSSGEPSLERESPEPVPDVPAAIDRDREQVLAGRVAAEASSSAEGTPVGAAGETEAIGLEDATTDEEHHNLWRLYSEGYVEGIDVRSNDFPLAVLATGLTTRGSDLLEKLTARRRWWRPMLRWSWAVLVKWWWVAVAAVASVVATMIASKLGLL